MKIPDGMTRGEWLTMIGGYVSLGAAWGIGIWNAWVGLGVYITGLVLVGLYSSRSFSRGIRAGHEIDKEIRESFTRGEIPDHVKDAVAQDMARRVELALMQRAAARQGRN